MAERAQMTKAVVLVAVDDMFFAAKIRAVADSIGVVTHLVKDEAGIIKTAREIEPALILVDLHARKFDPLALGRELKNDESLRNIELVGFFSHVQTQLQSEAKSAGFDRVLARSVFTRRLAEILRGEA
jgi:CheY-like chemotaxis protein